MFVLLAMTIPMRHCVRDKLTDYCITVVQLYKPFYSNMTKWDRYLHILRYLNFTDNRQTKILTDYGGLIEILNGTFSNFKTLPKIWLLIKLLFPSEEGYFSNSTKKHKHFSIKIFKLCDSTGYTYYTKIYLAKDST
jgi:hypothetical protein